MEFAIETIELDHGARLGISPLPGRWGSGRSDLAKIAEWSPTIVVSMTETAEMSRHNMADLGGLLSQLGIDWAHFPIRDFGAPKMADDWANLSARLRRVLAEGGRVLAHCYGGHGRSGMVLLRLMVELGFDPQVALARIRAVRPGAVETDDQFEWAAQGAVIKRDTPA